MLTYRTPLRHAFANSFCEQIKIPNPNSPQDDEEKNVWKAGLYQNHPQRGYIP
jgi:hypothetical protein